MIIRSKKEKEIEKIILEKGIIVQRFIGKIKESYLYYLKNDKVKKIFYDKGIDENELIYIRQGLKKGHIYI